MPDVTSARPRHARHHSPDASGHIVELHGLRGLALGLVVLFHLFGNGRVSGGVDVFLVISGFLVTRSLVRRADGPGIRLGQHLGRTAARLVPPALATFAGVALLAAVLLPPAQMIDVGREIVASALYVENWALIAFQLDYGAAGPTASPLQHFWSLSVQGQFFLLWPLAVMALAVVARRAGSTTGQVTAWFVAATTTASFAYAVHLTAVDQQVAYFDSVARYWELGAGALLALAAPHLRLPHVLRAGMSWLGLLLIGSAGLLVDGARLYPGPWTLWPVLGALLVLAGAGSTASWSPRRALQVRPLRFAADISYPLYLWHWPLLVFYLRARGYEQVGWRGAAALLALSVLLAWLTHRLVATPTRDRSYRVGPRRTLLAAAVSTALVVATGTGVVAAMEHRQQAALAQLTSVSPEHPGAAALAADADDSRPWRAGYRPSAEHGSADKPAIIDADDCIQKAGDGRGRDELHVCSVHRPPTPARHVVIAGGSHSYQWEPALTSIAEQQGWELTVLGKGGCRLAVRDAGDDCARWAADALDEIVRLAPDAVVVTGTQTRAGAPHPGETVEDEQVHAWQELQAHDIPVVAVRDNPRFDVDPPDCVGRHGPASERCTVARPHVLAPSNPLTTATVPDNVHPVDMSPWLCLDDECPAVVGNVLVYRDDDHLTATYVRTLAPYLRTAVQDAVPSLF
ncbi:acyltransferase family protein [Isoptericola sp. AK164]|uniref:acyltransferase family protein n=1 Tax=Isoptericola sp. AK164 TaxID=3024246 RepID=UPI002418B8F7|nr:acyltransferase family protein [Isoptericola sp. AK164]